MGAKFPRTGKWIVPAGKTWSPGSVVSVIAETTNIGVDPLSGFIASSLVKVHVAECHRRRGVWTGMLYRSFATGESFHNWLEMYASPRRRTYVFTPDVNRLMILTDWWKRIETAGCKLVRVLDRPAGLDSSAPNGPEGPAPMASSLNERAVVDAGTYKIQTYITGVQCDILKFSVHGRSYQLCKHAQYIDPDEEKIASAIKYRWRYDPSDLRGDTQIHRAAVDRVHLWATWYRELSDWWQSIDGGPWAATTAGMAWNFLKKRLKPRTVLHHNDERAGTLESQALHGGRCTVWYLGNVGGELDWQRASIQPPERSALGTLHAQIDHWDVKSMYPYLLRTMPFPIERLRFLRRVSPEFLLGAVRTFGVIARVVVRSLTPEYPVKTDRGIIYPIGTYTATLAGPELVHVLAAGEVLHVHSAALYKMGSPFLRAVEPLLTMRSNYAEQGLTGWELFVKSVMVKMSGKLAPHSYHWIPRPTMPAKVEWGEWRKRDTDTGEVRNFLARANMVWERVEATENIRPMGAAYAYLTAYGRVMMRGYRQLVPAKCVLAQATDGLWTTAAARSALGYVTDEEAATSGDLVYKRSALAARFWSHQRYWCEGEWVLSGIALPENDPGTATIRGRTEIGGLDRTQSTPRPLTLHAQTLQHLTINAQMGEIDPDGWVSPPRVHFDQG